MINVTKKPNDTHGKICKQEILEEITEKLKWKKIDMVNQNVRDALKIFQDT
jgi:hypothetical protein